MPGQELPTYRPIKDLAKRYDIYIVSVHDLAEQLMYTYRSSTTHAYLTLCHSACHPHSCHRATSRKPTSTNSRRDRGTMAPGRVATKLPSLVIGGASLENAFRSLGRADCSVGLDVHSNRLDIPEYGSQPVNPWRLGGRGSGRPSRLASWHLTWLVVG